MASQSISLKFPHHLLWTAFWHLLEISGRGSRDLWPKGSNLCQDILLLTIAGNLNQRIADPPRGGLMMSTHWSRCCQIRQYFGGHLWWLQKLGPPSYILPHLLWVLSGSLYPLLCNLSQLHLVPNGKDPIPTNFGNFPGFSKTFTEAPWSTHNIKKRTLGTGLVASFVFVWWLGTMFKNEDQVWLPPKEIAEWLSTVSQVNVIDRAREVWHQISRMLGVCPRGPDSCGSICLSCTFCANDASVSCYM